MKISGNTAVGSGQSGGRGMFAAAKQDDFMLSLQKQMNSLQQELQGISKDEALSAAEKEAKVRHLREQIANLQSSVDQNRAEAQRQKAEKAEAAAKERRERAVRQQREDSEGELQDIQVQLLFEEEFLRGVFNADASIKKASAARAAMLKMEARVRTLEAEIKLDGARGVTTAPKEEQLTTLRARVLDISVKLDDFRKNASQDAWREVVLSSTDKGHDPSERDKNIFQLESRTPLKVNKVWNHGKGKLVNTRT